MGNKMIDKAVNPFIQIAGARALAWGALGLLVSTVICYYAGYHYHGLLHFGPAPNPAWWCYAAEHLIVWLIPALLFYLGGKVFSHSRIRAIDVLGTVLFAELPLLGMTLIYLTPPMQMMANMDMSMSPQELLAAFYLAGCDSVVVGHSVSVAHPCVVVQCSESVVQPEGVAFVGSGPCRHLGR